MWVERWHRVLAHSLRSPGRRGKEVRESEKSRERESPRGTRALAGRGCRNTCYPGTPSPGLLRRPPALSAQPRVLRRELSLLKDPHASFVRALICRRRRGSATLLCLCWESPEGGAAGGLASQRPEKAEGFFEKGKFEERLEKVGVKKSWIKKEEGRKKERERDIYKIKLEKKKGECRFLPSVIFLIFIFMIE